MLVAVASGAVGGAPYLLAAVALHPGRWTKAAVAVAEEAPDRGMALDGWVGLLDRIDVALRGAFPDHVRAPAGFFSRGP
jgi:hypothetical protein